MKYIACSTITTHAVWIKRFLTDLDLNLIDGPVGIYCDNQAAISLVNSGANSSRGKHIEIHCHYIRDIIQKEEIEVSYIPTSDMIADPMIKWIPAKKFVKHVSMMRLMNISMDIGNGTHSHE